MGVQEALADAVSDDERLALASELHTHVREAIKCPNANHVLQKCIDNLRPHDSQFVINEILQGGSGAVVRVAKHRYGCRVLQRLFEHCSSGQMQSLAEELIGDGVNLATHSFGNYVLQHLYEHGSESQVLMLSKVLAAHVASVAPHSHGCTVLHKAFDHAGEEARMTLAKALLAQPALLVGMACSRHGHASVSLALQTVEASQRRTSILALLENTGKLMASRYGRVLCRHLKESLELLQKGQQN